jgi:capsular polysaccharide biosynthesis protein
MLLTPSQALGVLRDRWWVLLVAAVVAAVAAYGYTRLPGVEPRWRSSVSVQASGRFDYGNSLALERQLRPLAEKVRQLSVMREVDQRLHLDLPPERLLGLTRAEPVQDSNQIRIDVEDADQQRAEAIALELANVYTERHNASQEGTLRTEQVILTVLERPNAATLVWPQMRVIVPAAAALGLVVAAGVVLALALLDDTLKDAADVEHVLGLPLIGAVPTAVAHPRRARVARPARRVSSIAGAPASSTAGPAPQP